MKYKLSVSMHALYDIEDAINWYESIHHSLGEKIKSSLFDKLNYIEKNPL